MDKVNISIFGSCVSRDLFEADSIAHEVFDIKTYVARQSIISALSKPVSDVCEEDIHLDSAFQRRMVLGDLHKDAFEKLAGDGSEYLLVDMVDERLGVCLLGESVITLSTELVGCGYVENPASLRIRPSAANGEIFVNGKNLKDYCKEFAQKILAIYPEDKIIIHRALGVFDYFDENGQQVSFPDDQKAKCQNMNRTLGIMYDALSGAMPGAKVIDTKGHFIADQNHKWGLSIIHYEEDYYRYVLNEICRITGAQATISLGERAQAFENELKAAQTESEEKAESQADGLLSKAKGVLKKFFK